MTYEAIQHVLRYCDEQKAPVQITGPNYDSPNGIEWVADFANQIHASVCCEELKDAGHDATTPVGYYARII